jgi:PAS domain S-box-containing protein
MNNSEGYENRGDILIVDDELSSLRTLSDMLTAEGYIVRGAPDGSTALMIVENEPPDLILLDVRMPDMDGYQVCRTIKENKNYGEIPVLFLSALDEAKDKIEGFKIGALDFITKPFHTEEVLARVDTHITLNRLRRNLELLVEKRTAELVESEERYHSIFEASPASIMTVRNGYFVFVNPAGARMLGFSDAAEMVGKSVFDFVEPESKQLVAERIARLENGKNNPTAEVELIRQDGIRITVESTSVSVPIGGIPTAVIIAQDITESRQLRMKLKESETRLNSFMNHYPAQIYIKDQNLRHIFGNKFLLESFSIEPQAFIGTTSHDFFPSDVAGKMEENDRIVLAEKVTKVLEIEREIPDGRPKTFSDFKFPIQSEAGESFVGGIAIDITERKLNEDKLREAFEEIKNLKDRLEQENIYLREEIDLQHKHGEIIGKSKAILQMLNQAEQVADTDSTVLILGKTGTGKELLARAIHRMSSRHHRQMITVNCAALPASLIESEMFGREKGAFTGALSGRIGRFEIADGSTIFLDEIGELTPDVQMKLLRVLEEGQFERLGSNKTVKVDVRIIAATNRDLVKAVHDGSFRRDLYYRLNVFPITVPPLSDRTEDIELLAWTFVREYSDRMGKRIESIPRKTMDALKRWHWHGNIRELRNVIEQSMIVTKGTALNVQLPGTIKPTETQNILLEDVERNHIIKILKETDWRVRGRAGAAELLGLKPTTLDARMKKLGIVRPK